MALYCPAGWQLSAALGRREWGRGGQRVSASQSSAGGQCRLKCACSSTCICVTQQRRRTAASCMAEEGLCFIALKHSSWMHLFVDGQQPCSLSQSIYWQGLLPRGIVTNAASGMLKATQGLVYAFLSNCLQCCLVARGHHKPPCRTQLLSDQPQTFGLVATS